MAASDTPLPAHRQPLMGSERGDAEVSRPQARKRDAFPCVSPLAVLFFLGNPAVAIYTARDDAWEVAFVAGMSINMIGLFVAVGAYDRAPPEEASRLRQKLRVLIWGLATTLNLAFSYRVAAMMPAAVSLAIWGLGAFVALAGLWLLVFGCRDSPNASCGDAPRD